MSIISGIYWVDLSFINNYNEPQLWLVFLKYSADVANAFIWSLQSFFSLNSVTASLSLSLSLSQPHHHQQYEAPPHQNPLFNYHNHHQPNQEQSSKLTP